MGCTPSLSEGQWGTFRYFGEIRGEPPMRLLPPIPIERDMSMFYSETRLVVKTPWCIRGRLLVTGVVDVPPIEALKGFEVLSVIRMTGHGTGREMHW